MRAHQVPQGKSDGKSGRALAEQIVACKDNVAMTKLP
jgi:hypothetical protein